MKYNFIFIFILYLTVLGVNENELTSEELVDLSDHFRSFPVNINLADESTLYSVPYIDEITAYRIVEFIRENGNIYSLKSLTVEKIISAQTAKKISSMIKYSDELINKSEIQYRFRMKRTLENSAAYKDSSYLGNKSYFINKLNFRNGNVRVNFLSEKEAGEIYYTDNLKFSVEYKDNRKRLLLGNICFFSATKMLQYENMFADPFSVRQNFKFNDPVRSSLSSMDYYGYNGVYGSYNLGIYQISVFYGEKPLSVVLTDDDTINSVNLNSYTRTESEIERYHNEKNYFTGGIFQLSSNLYSASFMISDESYSIPVSEGSDINDGLLIETQIKTGISDNCFIELDHASDFTYNNTVIKSMYKLKRSKLSLYAALFQKEKLSLASQNVMTGNGEKEYLAGFKAAGKLFRGANFILESRIFNSEFEKEYLPGGLISTELGYGYKFIDLACKIKYSTSQVLDDEYSEINKLDSRLSSKIKINNWKLSTYLKYADWYNEGYGYLISQSVMFSPLQDLNIRIGTDLFYTRGSTLLYAGLYDIGLYPGLTVFSGHGKSVYGFISYEFYNTRATFGISEDTRSDSNTIGSGYDLIDSDSSHRFEFNLSYIPDF